MRADINKSMNNTIYKDYSMNFFLNEIKSNRDYFGIKQLSLILITLIAILLITLIILTNKKIKSKKEQSRFFSSKSFLSANKKIEDYEEISELLNEIEAILDDKKEDNSSDKIETLIDLISNNILTNLIINDNNIKIKLLLSEENDYNSFLESLYSLDFVDKINSINQYEADILEVDLSINSDSKDNNKDNKEKADEKNKN